MASCLLVTKSSLPRGGGLRKIDGEAAYDRYMNLQPGFQSSPGDSADAIKRTDLQRGKHTPSALCVRVRVVMCSTPGVKHGEQVAQDKQVAGGGGEAATTLNTSNTPTAVHRGILPWSTLTLTRQLDGALSAGY